MISMLKTFNRNPFVSIMAAGHLLMLLSAISIDVVSVAYGFGFDRFDMTTNVSVGGLSVIELMTEFTMPVAFIIGAFMTAGGFSGWLLIERQKAADYQLLA